MFSSSNDYKALYKRAYSAGAYNNSKITSAVTVKNIQSSYLFSLVMMMMMEKRKEKKQKEKALGYLI